MQKEEIYRGIKNIGFVSFIPFVMVAGPISGYFAGDFLQKKFNLPDYMVLIGIFFGFLASVLETIKIIKTLYRINKK